MLPDRLVQLLAQYVTDSCDLWQSVGHALLFRSVSNSKLAWLGMNGALKSIPWRFLIRHHAREGSQEKLLTQIRSDVTAFSLVLATVAKQVDREANTLHIYKAYHSLDYCHRLPAFSCALPPIKASSLAGWLCPELRWDRDCTRCITYEHTLLAEHRKWKSALKCTRTWQRFPLEVASYAFQHCSWLLGYAFLAYMRATRYCSTEVFLT